MANYKKQSEQRFPDPVEGEEKELKKWTRLVQKIARNYTNLYTKDESLYDDLVQDGMIGLLYGIRTYDASKSKTDGPGKHYGMLIKTYITQRVRTWQMIARGRESFKKHGLIKDVTLRDFSDSETLTAIEQATIPQAVEEIGGIISTAGNRIPNIDEFLREELTEVEYDALTMTEREFYSWYGVRAKKEHPYRAVRKSLIDKIKTILGQEEQ